MQKIKDVVLDQTAAVKLRKMKSFFLLIYMLVRDKLMTV